MRRIPASVLGSRRTAVVALSTLVASAAAWSQPVATESPGTALRRGDLDDVARLAQLHGRDAVASALTSPQRTQAIAAMVAVEARREPWPLPRLAVLAGGFDRRRASAATWAALGIVSTLDADAAAGADLDGDTLRSWRSGWLALAQRADLWIDVRVDGLEIAAQLARVAEAMEPVPPPAHVIAEMASLLSDPDPAMRRTAIELLEVPLPSWSRTELARHVSAETDPEVARSAAAALCSEVATGPAAPILQLLGADGLARIRALAQRSAPAVAADVELARCLHADRHADSAIALRGLLGGARGPMRRALLSLLRDGSEAR